ncbi:early boundary activity protein 2-like [Pieris rapae]|uniref:early boundary activity protein 2-like n=1 Tax=Pieris rapae TaxID=64459 RepID=UPI001E27D7DD|nr:early boundary activity protein 2-like [Pieris rapae]
MSSKSKIEKWLLADWSTSRGTASKFSEEAKSLAISTDRNESGNETDLKECQPKKSTASCGHNDSGAGGSLPNEDQDYSPSASSWEPSNSHSDDSDEEVDKENNIQQYLRQISIKRRNKKDMTPVHRPNAVVKVLQERKLNANQSRKRKHNAIHQHTKSFVTNSTKKTQPKNTMNIHLKSVLEIRETFQQLFGMINDLKVKAMGNIKNETLNHSENTKEKSFDDILSHRSEESNRSDDNVLITNKYSTVGSVSSNEHNRDKLQDEWVPIGSGKTLIHKDKYRKVNWKSYTIATRTLLLATFPRRILATHSLTGKRSPAFQNKPAKMCLDPKIVSDVLIEITSKFKVKENLVRSIITTKCADEAKMYKMRLESKKKNSKARQSSSDHEDVPLQNLKKERNSK